MNRREVIVGTGATIAASTLPSIGAPVPDKATNFSSIIEVNGGLKLWPETAILQRMIDMDDSPFKRVLDPRPVGDAWLIQHRDAHPAVFKLTYCLKDAHPAKSASMATAMDTQSVIESKNLPEEEIIEKLAASMAREIRAVQEMKKKFIVPIELKAVRAVDIHSFIPHIGFKLLHIEV